MGPSTFYDRFYDAVNYMDVNASYTFGRKVKMTFYAEANNLLNQPLRYYQGTKDRTMQAEYYGVKVNAGFKVNAARKSKVDDNTARMQSIKQLGV